MKLYIILFVAIFMLINNLSVVMGKANVFQNCEDDNDCNQTQCAGIGTNTVTCFSLSRIMGDSYCLCKCSFGRNRYDTLLYRENDYMPYEDPDPDSDFTDPLVVRDEDTGKKIVLKQEKTDCSKLVCPFDGTPFCHKYDNMPLELEYCKCPDREL